MNLFHFKKVLKQNTIVFNILFIHLLSKKLKKLQSILFFFDPSLINNDPPKLF